jgi:hypothetical protein
MNVKELKQLLENVPDDFEVLINVENDSPLLATSKSVDERNGYFYINADVQ